MSASNEWTPAEREQLEQELLELHFGCHEDAPALEARLAAEPALRELQAEVLQQANVLEAAVQPEHPRLALEPPSRTRRWYHHAIGRIVAVAAAALLGVLGFVGYERLCEQDYDAFRRERLHLTVSAPKAVPAGAPWSLTVQAADLDGEAHHCTLEWRAFAAGDEVLAEGQTEVTDGEATIALAADLRAPRRVELVAHSTSDRVTRTLDLSQAHAGPIVHVRTDRGVYRPGETVYARAVVLDRVTRLPLRGPAAMRAKLLDASDATVADEHAGDTEQGVGAFAFVVPATSAGGVHTIEVGSGIGLFATERAEIVVRPFREPQLDKTVVLDRKSYAPGARGSAAVVVRNLADDAPAAGAVVRGALVVDGDEVWSQEAQLDRDGQSVFRFEVPDEVERGAARFVATVTHGGVVEAEVEPFVVPTGRIDVAAFPEGGALVAGVENGLYLECTDPMGRAIDTAGELVDDREQRVAAFRTTHQGRCRLAFVPEHGRSYRVRVAGNRETFELPAVQQDGIAMRLLGDDVAAGAPLRLAIAGRGHGPWVVATFCRGVLVGQTTLRADDAGRVQTIAELTLPPEATGVLRTTIFDRELRPVAERLVRRLSARRLDVAVVPEHDVLAPGAAQRVRVETLDETGAPTAAVVGLSCTDQATLSLADEPQPGLVDHAMLFADVEKTEDLGDFFLAHEHSGAHVDLLLGTRGWRRFVWRNDDAAKAAIAAAGEHGEGVLAREGFSQTPQVSSNLNEARAGAMPLANASRHARDRARIATAVAIALLVLLLLGEGIAFGLRRISPNAPIALQSFAGVAGAVALLACGAVLLTNSMGAREMASAAVGADFGEPKSELMLFDSEPMFLPSDTIVTAWRLTETWSDDFAVSAGATELDASVIDLSGFGQSTTDLPNRQPAADPAFGVRRSRSNEEDEAPDYYLRNYAHEHVAAGSVRTDFTPTILWNALLVTDAQGTATAAFDTSDATTTWTVRADAHVASGATGRLGQASASFVTQLPLHVDVTLPDELSAGDRVMLPIACTLRGDAIDEVRLRAAVGDGLQLADDAPTSITLQDGRGRTLLPVVVGDFVGTTAVAIEVRAGRFVDRVRRTIEVAPRGFPHRRSAGGSIAPAAPGEWRLVVPDDAVPNSRSITLKVFPSPVAALTEGLDGILREPHGCFEQASSSNYPNTMVLNLIEASGDDVPMVAARARELLPQGYAKITGYECSELGYEWFGHDPGHEALTAYGLLQFSDMANVYDVDRAMVDRTRQWLLARRDGRGNYPHPTVDHHGFGGRDPHVTNAYVTYALLQTGTPAAELEVEIDALAQRVVPIDPVGVDVGSYELALCACALQLAGRPEADAALRMLAERQRDDGAVPGAHSTITMSGERGALIETTGFAILAWLRNATFAGNVRRAIEYLNGARDAHGTFGATQATITALRALTAYARETRTMLHGGAVRVFDGDEQLAMHTFSAGQPTALTFDLTGRLEPGEHTLRLEVDYDGEGASAPLPWAGDVAYHAERPADDPDTATALSASLRAARVVEGLTVALDVEIRNTTDRELPTPMATIALPAGLELQTAVLDDLQRDGRFAFWELTGRDLVLYWRKLDPAQRVGLTLDLVGRVPGTTTGAASRTWLYYTPEQRRWTAPLRIEVTPAAR